MTFQAGTVVRTRSGIPVEIVAILSPEQQSDRGDCVIGVLVFRAGRREISTWQRDGRFREDKPTELDLETPIIRNIADATLLRIVKEQEPA
jgi:hypothetical protein